MFDAFLTNVNLCSLTSRIEDSDLDSDEVDMILAGIYFGDPVSEKVDGGCNSNSGVELQTVSLCTQWTCFEF